MATATTCETCGHASTTASRPYNRGTCDACWADFESLDEAIEDLLDDIE